MAQVAWNVRGNRGTPFTIGLFHGDKDGHVMIYTNQKVVQIDFNVKESKEYSLLLDDELCKVAIEKVADDNYTYHCELDRESDTPLNLTRKAEKELEAKHEKQRLYVAGGVLLLFLLAWLIF